MANAKNRWGLSEDFGGAEKKRKLFHRALAIAIVSFMVLIAFQSVVPKVVAQEDVRILKIGSIEAIDSASPFVGIYDIAWVYYGLIYDCLTTIGKDLEVEPHLAHSWWYMNGTTANSGVEIPTDFNNELFGGLNDSNLWPMGSIWEYNLTENVYWNDGELFTAEDVVWTINTQIGPNFMVYWAYQPYTRWLHHAEMVDDYKVRIFFMDFQTNEPMPIAWGESLFFTIMPKHYFEDFPSTYMAYNWDGIPAIGTGPFMGTDDLREDIINREVVTLVKNPYYNFEDDDGTWKGLGAYYNRTMEIDRVFLKFFTEESALSLAVRTGDVDVAKIQPNTYNQWLIDESLPEQVKLVNNLACTSYSKQVCLNAYEEAPGTLNPLRLDPAVQRAAALAVNKTLIKDTVYGGLAEEGVALISPVVPKWWWEPPADEMCTWYLNDSLGANLFNYTKPMSDVMDYDPDLANQILDAAGYEWTGDEEDSVRRANALADARLHDIVGTPIGEVEGETLSFEMIIDSTVFEERLIGDRVKATWEMIGIYIDNELTSAAQWTTLIYSYLYNTMITYWSGDPDPAYLSFAPTSFALYGWNEFGTNSPEYDALYMEQAKALEYEERKAWMDETNKWLYLSGSVCTPVYPRICFAYYDYTWTNWGNWSQYPGLTIDHFWGGSSLWYTLEYTGIEEEEDSYLWLIVAAIAAGAIIAAVVTVSRLRKKKIEKEILLEEEAEEEPHGKNEN